MSNLEFGSIINRSIAKTHTTLYSPVCESDVPHTHQPNRKSQRVSGSSFYQEAHHTCVNSHRNPFLSPSPGRLIVETAHTLTSK